MSNPEPLLAQSIIAPRDLLLDRPQAQRLALFFETLGLMQIDRRHVPLEQLRQLSDELDFLAQEGVAYRIGFRTPPGVMIRFISGEQGHEAQMQAMRQRCDGWFGMNDPAGASMLQINDTEGLSLLVSKTLTYKKRPVVAYRTSAVAEAATATNAIELAIEHVPLPPDNMPWQDFLEFRADPEHRSHLHRLRTWIQGRALDGVPTAHIADELRANLDDYQRYMNAQHKKYGEGILSTLLVTGADVLEQLGNFKPGSAMRALFEIRTKRIELTESQSKAPGREMSYLVKAAKLTSGV